PQAQVLGCESLAGEASHEVTGDPFRLGRFRRTTGDDQCGGHVASMARGAGDGPVWSGRRFAAWWGRGFASSWRWLRTLLVSARAPGCGRRETNSKPTAEPRPVVLPNRFDEPIAARGKQLSPS